MLDWVRSQLIIYKNAKYANIRSLLQHNNHENKLKLALILIQQESITYPLLSSSQVGKYST